MTRANKRINNEIILMTWASKRNHFSNSKVHYHIMNSYKLSTITFIQVEHFHISYKRQLSQCVLIRRSFRRFHILYNLSLITKVQIWPKWLPYSLQPIEKKGIHLVSIKLEAVLHYLVWSTLRQWEPLREVFSTYEGVVQHHHHSIHSRHVLSSFFSVAKHLL